jgi:sulfur carrier protein ThiS
MVEFHQAVFLFMSATIKITGSLKSYTQDRSEIQIEPGLDVRQTLVLIGIPPEIIALVLVNDIAQSKDYLVCDGDKIQVVAIIGGGSAR